MSGTNELAKLQEKKKKLELRLMWIDPALTELYGRNREVKEMIEKISTRNSSIAQSLLTEFQNELEGIGRQIIQNKKEKEDATNELEKIYELEEKLIREQAEIYVKNQVQEMVSNFLEYVEKNLRNLALNLHNDFLVQPVTKFEDDRYGGCYVPTGAFCITNAGGSTQRILTTKKLTSDRILYTISRDNNYDNLYCQWTEWYKAFQDNFISTFLKTLEEEYAKSEYEKNFKLTIKDSTFTLELV